MDTDTQTHPATRRWGHLVIMTIVVFVVIIATVVPVMIMPVRRDNDYRSPVVIMVEIIGHRDPRYRQKQSCQQTHQ